MPRPTRLPTIFALMLLGAAACGPEYPNCDDDEDCREGEFCVNNLCVRCRSTADCGRGQECRDGACRDIPGYCDADRRCPAGQVCRDNRCQACTGDAECGPGMVCLNGACVPRPQCDADRPCPAGEECINGTCRQVGGDGEAGCRYEPVYFDYDRDAVRRDQRDVLQRNRQCLSERGRPARLTGYCDERGTEEYNLALGERRARAVQRYLTTLGVDRASIAGTSSRGKLGSQHCFDESCWQQDRRVEMRD
jgi:peptidoglycan-associated lipoprotein